MNVGKHRWTSLCWSMSLGDKARWIEPVHADQLGVGKTPINCNANVSARHTLDLILNTNILAEIRLRVICIPFYYNIFLMLYAEMNLLCVLLATQSRLWCYIRYGNCVAKSAPGRWHGIDVGKTTCVPAVVQTRLSAPRNVQFVWSFQTPRGHISLGTRSRNTTRGLIPRLAYGVSHFYSLSCEFNRILK